MPTDSAPGGHGSGASEGRAMGSEAPLEGVVTVLVGRSRAADLLHGLLVAQGATPALVELAAEGGGAIEVCLGRGAPARDDDRARAADDLLEGADVVIDPRPAGTPAPPGWSSEELRSRCRPTAIYCRMPPFSTDDARWRDRRASDEVLAGLLGAYVVETDGTPTLSSLPISACFAALSGALGIAAALVARARFGTGQGVEVSEFDATLLAVGARALTVNGRPGAARPSDPWSGPFRCRDGRWVWANLATPRAVRRLASFVGTELAWERRGFLGTADLGELSPARSSLEAELRALFLTRTAAAWDSLGAELGISLTMVRTAEEVRGDSSSRGEDTMWEEVNAAFAEPRTVELRSVPTPGAPSETLVDWEGERPEPEAWSVAGRDPHASLRRPLAGVRVLDATQMLAGPLAGRLLADLGASVIKVNDPHENGAGYRWQENRYHTDVNRGKATALIDLTRAEGRAIAERLIATADVVIENLRTDAAGRLGLDEASLRARTPALCHAHVSAYSLPSRSDAPGYEPNAQATAGLMSWDPATGAPRMAPFAVNDYGTGLLCAFGVTLALYRRLNGGTPCSVHASLSRTAFFLARAAAELRGAPEGPSPGGERAHGASGAEGSGAVARGGHLGCLWRVRDGWLVVEDTSWARRVLATLSHARAAGKDASSDPATQLADLDADLVLSHLLANDVVAGVLGRHAWQARREELEARGVLHTHRDGDRYVVTAVGNPIQLETTPVRRGAWVARPGQDGPALLEAMGVSEQTIERLLDDGVLAIG